MFSIVSIKNCPNSDAKKASTIVNFKNSNAAASLPKVFA
jgi:hypothetical protein